MKFRAKFVLLRWAVSSWEVDLENDQFKFGALGLGPCWSPGRRLRVGPVRLGRLGYMKGSESARLD
jgi:hypothetical protein